MSTVEEREIVAVRTEMVHGHEHIIAVKLADGTIEDASDVFVAIEEHRAHYFMVPPEGAPAREAYEATGLPLLVQTGICPDCNEAQITA